MKNVFNKKDEVLFCTETLRQRENSTTTVLIVALLNSVLYQWTVCGNGNKTDIYLHYDLLDHTEYIGKIRNVLCYHFTLFFSVIYIAVMYLPWKKCLI